MTESDAALWDNIEPLLPGAYSGPSPLTPEEEEAARAFVSALVGTITGKARNCPQCGRYLVDAVKRGRSVYGDPCGCRMYQGDVPEWAKPAGGE